MAFNRRNFLNDVLWVQERYQEGKAKGYNNRQILRLYINIEGRKAIAESTLYNYLLIPATRDLKRLEEAEKRAEEIKKMQLNLF